MMKQKYIFGLILFTIPLSAADDLALLHYHSPTARQVVDPCETFMHLDTYEQEQILKECMGKYGSQLIVDNLTVQSSITHNSLIKQVLFNPESTELATVATNIIRVWSQQYGHKTVNLAHASKVYTFCYNHDGSFLASSTKEQDEHVIVIWDMLTGERAATLKAHAGLIHKLIYSYDGSLLFSAAHDQSIGFWDTEDNSWFWGIDMQAVVDAMALNCNSSHISFVCTDQKLSIWDVIRKKTQVTYDLSSKITKNDKVLQLSYAPNNKEIILLTKDTILFFDALTAQFRHMIDNGHSAMQFDTQKLICLGDMPCSMLKGEVLCGYDLETKACIYELEHPLHITSMALSPDGLFIATISDGQLSIWDAQQGNLLYAKQLAGTVKDILFNNDGTQLVCVYDDGDAILFKVPRFEELIASMSLKKALTILKKYGHASSSMK